jgi:hypothetical protein
MEDAEGTFLLETLTNFVCDRVANEPFEHDLYVMAPCCEPAGMAEHQPITILLIAVKDLALFESWPACREVLVEHGQDGVRLLTLMELANRFRTEQQKIASLRAAGKRTRYVETMFVLDLALDRRIASIPVKNVPWGRFEGVLRQMNLESRRRLLQPLFRCDLYRNLEAKVLLRRAMEGLPIADPERIEGRIGGKLGGGRLAHSQC